MFVPLLTTANYDCACAATAYCHIKFVDGGSVHNQLVGTTLVLNLPMVYGSNIS